MRKGNHIGGVADILELNPRPDPSIQEDCIITDEQPESVVQEMDEVDGEIILSFASVEEMEVYVARKESRKKTKDFTQIKEGKNKFQQLTPLLPPPCPSLTTPSLPQSKIPKTSVSAAASTNKVFSDLSDAPGTSVGTEHEERVICQKEEIIKEILSSTTEEEADLGSENLISAELTECAISTVSIPPIERKKQAAKKLDAMSKEIQEIPSCRTSLSNYLLTPRKSKKGGTKVPTTPKVNVDATFDDTVLNEDEYQDEYGIHLTNIFICYLNYHFFFKFAHQMFQERRINCTRSNVANNFAVLAVSVTEKERIEK